MPLSTARELTVRFPDTAVHHFFGLTETISITHVLDVREQAERAESIGQLIPYVDARIVDEQGREAAPGQVGELLFARENVIPGYFRLPEKLQEALVELDGRTWFRTGDLAAVDEDGFYFIKGRRKDMIIVGGENVYAAEVEAALTAHELVRDAAVKGVPATGVRQALGEMIKAFVVPASPSLTEQDVRRHCVHALPSYKVPHIIVFLDRLPRNPSGKVVKDQLP
jgi:fatty-acyl-CoA synthase